MARKLINLVLIVYPQPTCLRANIKAIAGKMNMIADHSGIMPDTPTVPMTPKRTSEISIATHIVNRLPARGAPLDPVAIYPGKAAASGSAKIEADHGKPLYIIAISGTGYRFKEIS